MRPSATALPLTGVRVLDLTRLLPGNFATLALALLGADVIKVEDSGAGDYQREFGVQLDGAGASHHMVNRAKRSVVIDLKTEAGRRRFEQLVQTSHVLVESFRPGVLGRLGYPIEKLHELRADLVVASISGYGASGPLAQVAGHDLNYLAESGVLDQMGRAGGLPSLPPLPLADLIGGGLLPALLIIAYLREAERTGQGHWVDASMTEGVALLPHVLVADVVAGADAPERGAGLLTGGLACYSVYRCADGEVVVGALENRFWTNVCDVVGGLDDYRRDHWNPTAQEPIRERLTDFFAKRTRAEVESSFAGIDACVSVARSFREALATDHAIARGYLQSAVGCPIPVLAFPAMVDGKRLPEQGRAPSQGEHTEDLFGETEPC
jgi:alpha-methylacyl-CoA racemase